MTQQKRKTGEEGRNALHIERHDICLLDGRKEGVKVDKEIKKIIIMLKIPHTKIFPLIGIFSVHCFTLNRNKFKVN